MATFWKMTDRMSLLSKIIFLGNIRKLSQTYKSSPPPQYKRAFPHGTMAEITEIYSDKVNYLVEKSKWRYRRSEIVNHREVLLQKKRNLII